MFILNKWNTCKFQWLDFWKDIVPAQFIIIRHLITLLHTPLHFLIVDHWAGSRSCFPLKKKKGNNLVIRVTGAGGTLESKWPFGMGSGGNLRFNLQLWHLINPWKALPLSMNEDNLHIPSKSHLIYKDKRENLQETSRRICS